MYSFLFDLEAQSTRCSLSRYPHLPIHKPKQPQPMRFLFSLLFSLFLLQGATAQVITVLRNGQSFFHYDVSQLATLISTTSPAHTLPGDTIILPGGSISCPNIGINKPLTISGAGILQSGAIVTEVTQWTSTTPNQGTSPGFYIQSGGAGSSFHGIVFNSSVRFTGAGNNAPAFSASFTRCSLRGGLFLSTFGQFSIWSACPANVTFKQCLITGINFGASSTAVTNFQLNNCFIAEAIGITGANAATSTFVNQCIILGAGSHTANAGVVFSNNIFVKNTGTFSFQNSNATFYNNVFGTQAGGVLPTFGMGATESDNVPAANTSIFENVTDFTFFFPNFNYQLSAGSQASGIGEDGFDAGVYSGPPGNPWKPNAIPFNPHWTGLLPSGGSLGTTTGGVINVTIQGAAQQN